MTWTKLGAEFWEELAAEELSDAAVRTHGEVVSWLYNVDRPSCLIPKSKVYKVTNSPDNRRAVVELCELGMWVEHDREFEVVHHGNVIRQSLAAQAAKKDRDATAQQRRTERARAKAIPVTGPVTGPVTPQTDSQTGSHETEAPTEAADDYDPWDGIEIARPPDRFQERITAKVNDGYDR